MGERESLDLLISGGTLLTMSQDMKVIEEPVIGVKDGNILFVNEGEDESARRNAKRDD